MTQLDLVKSFLEDIEIQQKYNIASEGVAQMNMMSQFNSNAQVLVDLIRHMTRVVEDPDTSVNSAARSLYNNLENALH